MSPRFPIFTSSSEGRTATLQGLIIAAIVITGLYVAREVLLPLALAILLSFVLTPALLFLRRLKVPRVVGVAIVVAFAFALIFGLGWLMSQQATQLAGDLPRYQHVLAEKISALRKSASGAPALEKATEAVKGLERELANPTPEPKVGTEASPLSKPKKGASRSRSRSMSRRPSPLNFFNASQARYFRRWPRLASSFSSSSSYCYSARICETGQFACSALRTCSALPQR